jgi:hypothetical protein
MQTDNIFSVLVSRKFSVEQCRINFDTLFIFGDNLERTGTGGQAIIREQKNSLGFATKKAPGGAKEDYFTDEEYGTNCKIIEEEIEKIKKYAKEHQYKSVAFPFMGLGTGLSEMPIRCPQTFFYLCTRLQQEFKFNNVEGAYTK